MEFIFPKGGLEEATQPKSVTNAIRFLDKQKDGTLFTTRDLCIKLGLQSFGHYSAHPALDDYRAQAPNKHAVYWGSKKTIAAFKKEFPKK